MKHSIVIIDDHPVLRDGVAMMLQIEPDLELIGQAESCAEATELLRKTSPDLALVDVSLKDGNGIDLIERLRKEHPALAVLVLSAYDERRHAESALKAGARGYIMKNATRDELLGAIRAVLAGQYYLSPKVSPELIGKMLNPAAPSDPPVQSLLSDRELEIFAMIGEGKTTDQIARSLFLSPKTIRAHRYNIMKKLEIKGSIQLYQRSFAWVGERRGPAEPPS